MLSRLASSLVAFTLLSSSTFAVADPISPAGPSATEIHLEPVAKATIDRAKLRGALAKRRAANIAAFRAYRLAGSYPHNFDTDGKLNVWRDGEGRLCAAATMIAASGSGDLAMRVAADNNFIRLGDVTDGELMDWILTSGLTQAEIAAIQEPFEGDVGMIRILPVEPVSPQRLAEDDRLRAKYRAVERQLARAHKASLDRATDLLMQHPDLAAQVLAG